MIPSPRQRMLEQMHMQREQEMRRPMLYANTGVINGSTLRKREHLDVSSTAFVDSTTKS